LKENPWKATSGWAAVLEQRGRHKLPDLGRFCHLFTCPKARSALLKPSVSSLAHARLLGVKDPEQAHKNTQTPAQNHLASFFFSFSSEACKGLYGQKGKKPVFS